MLKVTQFKLEAVIGKMNNIFVGRKEIE